MSYDTSSDGGQRESLVPPFTCGIVLVSYSVMCLEKRAAKGLRGGCGGVQYVIIALPLRRQSCQTLTPVVGPRPARPRRPRVHYEPASRCGRAVAPPLPRPAPPPPPLVPSPPWPPWSSATRATRPAASRTSRRRSRGPDKRTRRVCMDAPVYYEGTVRLLSWKGNECRVKTRDAVSVKDDATRWYGYTGTP
jgi:hypothetical protein